MRTPRYSVAGLLGLVVIGACDKYVNSCKDCHIAGTVLHCNCLDTKGHYHQSGVDLEDYIGNLNGKLQWGSYVLPGYESHITAKLLLTMLILAPTFKPHVKIGGYSRPARMNFKQSARVLGKARPQFIVQSI